MKTFAKVFKVDLFSGGSRSNPSVPELFRRFDTKTLAKKAIKEHGLTAETYEIVIIHKP